MLRRPSQEHAERVPWLAAGAPLNPGIHLQSDDEVFRIGNAAGEAHPIIGEGMSMALQSAWVLCGHLLGAGKPHATASHSVQRRLHEAYEADWRRFFARRLHLAAAFAQIAMRPSLFAPPGAFGKALCAATEARRQNERQGSDRA
ncbi:MAG: hypothetical protein WDM77_14850 [Steroidobacteraceae bacterium]